MLDSISCRKNKTISNGSQTWHNIVHHILLMEVMYPMFKRMIIIAHLFHNLCLKLTLIDNWNNPNYVWAKQRVPTEIIFMLSRNSDSM